MSELQLLQDKIDELNRYFGLLDLSEDGVLRFGGFCEVAYIGDPNFKFTKEHILEIFRKNPVLMESSPYEFTYWLRHRNSPIVNFSNSDFRKDTL